MRVDQYLNVKSGEKQISLTQKALNIIHFIRNGVSSPAEQYNLNPTKDILILSDNFEIGSQNGGRTEDIIVVYIT